MDLMTLVPSGVIEDFSPFIVHTDKDCIFKSKYDDDELGIKHKGSRCSLLKYRILSRTHPYTQMYLKSDTVIRYEILKHLSLYPRMIHPASKMRYFWEWFQTIFTIIALTIVPLLNSFYLHLHENWKYVMFLINVTFTCDVILCFFTGYVDKYTRHVILDSKLVTSNYLKSYFWVDVLSSFPIEILAIYWLDENMVTNVYCAIFNMLSLLRIRNLLVYAKNIQHAHRYPLNVYKIFKAFTIITLSVHWGTCLQYFVPVAIKHLRFDKNYEEVSWIFGESMAKRKTVLEQYILCMNRAVISFVCSTHYLDVIAWEDVILNLIFALIGKGGFIFLLVQTKHLMTSYGSLDEHAQKQHLEEYIRNKKLPHDIRKRLHIYCNYISKKHFESGKSILHDIPAKLKEVITLFQ